MQDEERLSRSADSLRRIVLLEILQELPADGEGPAADIHFRFTGREDLLFATHQQPLDVLRVARRTDCRDGARFGDGMRGGSTAAPPRLWPMRSCGAWYCARR